MKAKDDPQGWIWIVKATKEKTFKIQIRDMRIMYNNIHIFKYRLVMKTKWQLLHASMYGTCSCNRTKSYRHRFLCSIKIPQQLAAFSCRTISSICQPCVLYVCHIPVGQFQLVTAAPLCHCSLSVLAIRCHDFGDSSPDLLNILTVFERYPCNWSSNDLASLELFYTIFFAMLL